MKTLIILSGVTNSGKSETLNLLIDQIKSHYRVAKGDFKCVNKSNPRSSVTIVDRRVVIKNLGKNNIKLGINTAGDSSDDVKRSIKLFDEENCDIVVCATKASGSSKNGSLYAMQKEIIKKSKNINIIPLFKIMNNTNSESLKSDNFHNDNFHINLLMRILNYYIVIKSKNL